MAAFSAAGRTPRVWIIAAYLLLALLYLRATPPLEASDEAGHFASVLYIKQHHRLPVADPADPSPLRSQEYVQPPLYYALGALLISPVDTSNHLDFYVRRAGAPVGRADIPGPKNMMEVRGDRSFPWRGTMLAIMLVRSLSVVLGLGTVLVTRALTRRVFPGEERAADVAAAWVAFNPMFLFISTSVNNDNLAVLLISAGLLFLLRARDRGFSLGDTTGLALLCGLAMLAKASGVLLAVAAGVALLWCRASWAERARKVVVLVGVAGAVVSWWFVRNHQVYGEWFGFRRQVWMVVGARQAVDLLALFREWDGFVKSYWGVFGGFNVIFPDAVYYTFYVITALSLVAMVAAICRHRAWGVVVLAGFFMLNLFACAWWTSWNLGSQGRLLFYSIAPTAALVAAGTLGANRRAGLAAAAGVVTVLLAFAFYGALRIIPSQYP